MFGHMNGSLSGQQELQWCSCVYVVIDDVGCTRARHFASVHRLLNGKKSWRTENVHSNLSEHTSQSPRFAPNVWHQHVVTRHQH